jgi:hypothetical protein
MFSHYRISVFHFAVLPSSTYLFTVGVEGFLFSLDHIQTHTTVGKTPLDEGSARRRNLYLITQTLYNRQTSMPLVGFEPTIPASARSQTFFLDRATTSNFSVLGENSAENGYCVFCTYSFKETLLMKLKSLDIKCLLTCMSTSLTMNCSRE